MSFASRLKREVHYETDVPRCQNCKHYRQAKTITVKGIVRKYPHQCALHDFFIKPCAVCDRWLGKDGATLDT